MNIESIWIIILAASTPIAGIVGFSIQLRNVKKVRLENEKLELEISQLKNAAKESASHIKIATNEEVEKYILDTKDAYFSRQPAAESKTPKYTWSEILILIVLLVVLIYFVYDMYRLISWLISKF